MVVDHDQQGAGIAGVIVLSHDPGGALVGRTTTDADGTATIAIVAGGSVSLLPPDGTPAPANGITYVGVSPGDVLRNGNPALGPSAGQLEIDVPADATPPVGYVVFAPGVHFHDQPVPRTLRVDLDAARPPTSDLVIEAQHDTGDPQFLVAKNVALAPGTTIDLGARSWSAPDNVEVAFTGVPSTTTSGQFLWSRTQGGRTVWYLPDNVGAPTSGAWSATVGSPGAVGDSDQVSVSLFDANASHEDTMTFTGRGTAIDVSTTLLPRPAPTVDADGTVSWSTSGGAVSPIATVLWLRDGAQAWMMIVPGDRTSAHVPALPSDLAARWPAGAVTAPESWFVGSDDVGGYGEYRTAWQATIPYGWASGTPTSPNGYRVSSGPLL
jgi:hypothetical protein